jgi:hypothetical protein
LCTCEITVAYTASAHGHGTAFIGDPFTVLVEKMPISLSVPFPILFACSSSSSSTAQPTARTSWRQAILNGINTRAFKFAQGAALVDLAKTRREAVPLIELASAYATRLVNRTGNYPQAREFLQRIPRGWPVSQIRILPGAPAFLQVTATFCVQLATPCLPRAFQCELGLSAQLPVAGCWPPGTAGHSWRLVAP